MFNFSFSLKSKKRRPRIKSKDFIAYFLIFIISLQYGFTNTDLEIVGTGKAIILLISITLFAIYLLMQRYSVIVLTRIFFFLLIAFITLITSGSYDFVYLFIVATVFAKISYEISFNIIFYTRLCTLVMVVSLSLIGILDKYQRVIYKLNDYAIGYGLGYTHPNRLAHVLFYLILIHMCLKKNRFTLHNYFIDIIVLVFGYSITRSRTLVLLVIITLLLRILISIKSLFGHLSKVYCFLAQIIIPFCAFISIGIPILMIYGSGNVKSWLEILNTVTNNRFTMVRRAFLNYPVTTFGGRVDFSNLLTIYGFDTIDNGYARLLYLFGIVGLIVFILLSIFATNNLIKKQEYVYLIVIIAIAVWGVSENIITSFAFDFIPVFWSSILVSDNVFVKKRFHKKNSRLIKRK